MIEKKIKQTVLVAVLIAAASTASAGGMMEPVMEAPVLIKEDQDNLAVVTGSVAGGAIPLAIGAVVLVAAVVGGGTSGTTGTDN